MSSKKLNYFLSFQVFKFFCSYIMSVVLTISYVSALIIVLSLLTAERGVLVP